MQIIVETGSLNVEFWYILTTNVILHTNLKLTNPKEKLTQVYIYACSEYYTLHILIYNLEFKCYRPS